MTDHSSAIVPIESWAYASPSLRYRGIQVDIGLLAEALIYYDSIHMNVANQPQFADVIDWFRRQGAIDHLIGLIEDGVLAIYEYSFASAAVLNEGVYSIWNIQDVLQQQAGSFEQRYLGHPTVRKVLPGGSKRRRLIRAIREHVTEAKAAEFGPAIENSKADFDDPRRNAVLVQAFVDELYELRGLGQPPQIEASIRKLPERGQTRITYNADFGFLSDQAGENINFNRGSPLTANAVSNRLLLSASKLKCDLYLPSPLSMLSGDKLFEVATRVLSSSNIVQQLEETVEFPDVRSLVNRGELSLSNVLDMRAKSGRFRQWLQTEAERDRDAIIAYHHEVSKDSGFSRGLRSTLKLFGILAGGAAGAYVGGKLGGLAGGAAGAATQYLLNLGTDIRGEWRPVVFGNWMKGRIDSLMAEYEGPGDE